MLKLEPDFVRRISFEAAIQGELDRPPDRLPSRIAETAVTAHHQEYGERVAGLCLSGFEPEPVETMWMPKGRFSFRPLAAAPLLERIVYRALANDFAANVGELDAYQQTQDTFESALLESDDEEAIQYVVIADVSSFYRYVSHSVLEERVVETTARADLASALRTFLDLTMKSEVGLPQNLGPSDLFADVILTQVERRMLRSGVATTRFNDDFRLGARTLTGARDAISLLQEHLHGVGLTLNEAKTIIMTRVRFLLHIGDLLADEYVEEVAVEPRPTPDTVNEALSELGDALQIGHDDESRRTPLENARAAAQVRRLLRRFTRWSNPGAITFGRPIINRHPSAAQNYARYARQVADDGYSDEVASYLDGALDEMTLTAWQELWLLEPILGRENQPERLAAWVTTRVEQPDAPGLLRSRALLVAARAGLTDADFAARLIDTLPSAASPDAIATFAITSDDANDVASLGGLSDSELARWIFQRAFQDPSTR